MVGSNRMPLALAAPLVVSGLMLSGCMSGPTYGTDKTATEQLTSDLTGMFSIKPKANRVGEYKPRPDLVKPASLAELPPPQDSIAGNGNPAWPESPEQRRARIRAEATNNQDNNLYEPLVINDVSRGKVVNDGLSPNMRQKLESAPMSSAEARQAGREVARRQQENKQGSPTTRKYLSEPPLTYRQPAETASTDDLGEDEVKKQRRLKREASGGKSWRDWIPGL
ncbi:MAG: hypothetical protein ABTQ31_15755 [Rhizobiaceae bacterium]